MNILDQMIKFTYEKNLTKFSIWSLFAALTPYVRFIITHKFYLSCNLIVPLINLIAPWVATQLRHFRTIVAPSLDNVFKQIC